MTAPHRYVFLGPQGSGKGTQAARLAQYLGVPHVSTGELFRAAVVQATPLGQKIRAALAEGRLIADGDTNTLLREEFRRRSLADGYILDGYPRNVAQAAFLETLAAPVAVVALDLADDEAVSRISGRRVCARCGAMYHEAYAAPRTAGRCDACGGALAARQDDTEPAVRERLRLYHRETEPLLGFYDQRGRLLRVDARPGINDVQAAIRRVLGV